MSSKPSLSRSTSPSSGWCSRTLNILKFIAAQSWGLLPTLWMRLLWSLNFLFVWLFCPQWTQLWHKGDKFLVLADEMFVDKSDKEAPCQVSILAEESSEPDSEDDISLKFSTLVENFRLICEGLASPNLRQGQVLNCISLHNLKIIFFHWVKSQSIWQKIWYSSKWQMTMLKLTCLWWDSGNLSLISTFSIAVCYFFKHRHHLDIVLLLTCPCRPSTSETSRPPAPGSPASPWTSGATRSWLSWSGCRSRHSQWAPRPLAGSIWCCTFTYVSRWTLS